MITIVVTTFIVTSLLCTLALVGGLKSGESPVGAFVAAVGIGIVYLFIGLAVNLVLG
jgi:hypothetical protein